jgi:3-dehydroquinate synthase
MASSIQQSFQVRYQYSVHFTENLFAPDNSLLRDIVVSGGRHPSTVLFAVDAGVSGIVESVRAYSASHRDAIRLSAGPLVVPGGEAVMNTERHPKRILRAIHRHGLCRQSFVVAVGGGAVLDMAGYAAAIAHRGVRLIRVPTTVLSQNDSGVGVKNAVNAFGKKNFVGVFAPPFAVLNDFTFLKSLSDRHWRSGIAEAVKVALIKDRRFFARLERDAAALAAREMQPMRRLIIHCADLHLRHIGTGGDPFETGSSRPLDFGHWAAHKLEQLSNFRLYHGEAVAIGMALDSTYSYLAGMLAEPEWRRILALLAALGFKLYVPELDSPQLIGGLNEFREHLGGELTVMLLERIGRGREVHEIDVSRVSSAIGLLRQAGVLARNRVLEGRKYEQIDGQVHLDDQPNHRRLFH